ncbi:osteoclast stimulatory transmembrane protein [Synchiropus picturatus]
MRFDSVAARLRSTYGLCFASLTRLLQHLWDVFSSPSLAGQDVLTLVSLCLALSIVTGALLHHWLAKTLGYDGVTSTQTACIYSVLMFLASFLSHPLRCLLTLMLPTVSTKQGRKVVLSASVMLLMLNVVPNITGNVGVVVRLLRCTAEAFAQNLLNSSEHLNVAKRDLVEEMIKVKVEDFGIVSTLRRFDHITHVNVSAVKSYFVHMIRQIDLDFSPTRDMIKDVKLVSCRILGAVFVAFIIVESARYMKSYLTSVQFAIQQQKLVRRRRITREEFGSCFISLLVVTLYFLAITSVVALDYVVYHIVETMLPWLLDFPPTSAVISVDYKVHGFLPAACIIPHSCRAQELANFQHEYSWNFNPERSLCDEKPSAPNMAVTVLLGALVLLSYLLVFAEVFAARLRWKISASFFREQERKRLAFVKPQGGRSQEQVESVRVVTQVY